MNPATSSSQVRGACGHDCPDTCSWIVDVDGTTATRLYGDPEHPFTRGTLCAKVNHYLERVYHRDRVLQPLKRVGAKGEGRFTPVSWDQALADIARRWTAIVDESGAEAILPFSLAGNQGMVQIASLDRRLFGALGATQLTRALCGVVASEGLCATQGNGFGIDPEDLVHSRLIVLWGTNTLVTNLHLWPVIRQARERGATLVVIDPVRTRTAEAADWHLQVKPGSDTALALAMMHVIIRDGHVDHDYVSRHATGLEALVERARAFPPARVAALTGLTEGDIERLATLYATTQPSLLRPLIGLEHHHNGAMMFRTIACLPVLTGAWRHRGGGLARSTHAIQYAVLNEAGLFMRERWQPARTLNMRDLGRDLCSRELAPPVRALMVWNCNPAVTLPNQGRVLEGLTRDDLFTVVHDLFVTDTGRYADYVLPATSQIEHLDIVPAWGHHYLSLNRPAISPRGESVCNTELFRRLARALGRDEPWLFESDEALIRTALASGHPFVDGITFEALWERGYQKLRQPEDWRPFADGGFTTPSGKAELFSAVLAERGLDPLPAWSEGPDRGPFPLQLMTGKTLHYLNTSYSHMERHARREGTLLVALHPDEVARRGLSDGGEVTVFNDAGEVAAVCRASTAVGHGVAFMPFGALRNKDGGVATANVLTPDSPTDWGGGSAFCDAFVDVR